MLHEHSNPISHFALSFSDLVDFQGANGSQITWWISHPMALKEKAEERMEVAIKERAELAIKDRAEETVQSTNLTACFRKELKCLLLSVA
jgi:hypothetical protein